MDRVEEIRERVEKLRASPTLQIAAGHVHPDYTYLLERIDELERENERLKIPKGGYEEMCAKFAVSLEECATQKRNLERENRKLYDLAVENGTEASRERSRIRELLLYLESAEGHDETWSTPKEVLAERVLDAARMFREETNFA